MTSIKGILVLVQGDVVLSKDQEDTGLKDTDPVVLEVSSDGDGVVNYVKFRIQDSRERRTIGFNATDLLEAITRASVLPEVEGEV